jgi:probable phosphoglycerate mutase
MIYFIRHGESEANLKHVFAGQKDNSPLTQKGIEQAKAEGLKIKEMGLNISKVISSPLVRAFDTAKIVSEIIGYNKEIEIDQRITEYDMGMLTGTPTFEISSKILVKAENAEDPKKFDDRVDSFLKEWNEYDGDVLMVAHAGVGRIIETIKLGTNPELFYDIPPYPNASVIKLDWLK